MRRGRVSGRAARGDRVLRSGEPRVLAAVEHVYQCLADGADFEQYPFVN